MRRNEPRASSRSERIIHQGDAQYRPRAAAHLPRSRAKILEVDESTTASQVLAYEESVRHHFALDQFGHVGADVSEAASAWSAGREHGRREVEVPTAPRKPFSVDPKRIPKPLRHLLAGAFSGGISKTATAPLESVRMKLMVSGSKGALASLCQSLANVASSTWKAGGFRAFFAGNLADVIRTAPQKSVQLASFDAYKKLFASKDPLTGRSTTPGWASAVCGAAAGVTSTITCFPLEVLRTRLACSDQYRNLVHAAAVIVKNEGPKALFGGLGPSLAGVIPYAGCNLGMYDALRYAYSKSTGQERVPKLAALCIGSVAGVTAATVTFPLEVVRRRMMCGAKFANTAVALSTIARMEGTGALFSGCLLNWVKLAPSAGLSFYFYEYAKESLGLAEATTTQQLPAKAKAPKKRAEKNV